MNYPESFTLTRLFRKTSAKRNDYFVGRLGGARVTLLKSREVADDGAEVWQLMLAEAPQRAQDGRQRPAASYPAQTENGRPGDSHESARRDWQAPPEQ